MKNNFFKISIIVGSLVLLVALAGFFKFNFSNDDIYLASGGKLNSKDGVYKIDNKEIRFKDGFYEVQTTPDSASKNLYRYFGNDVTADFNNDGKQDTAFLLTEETGGSGTFFYVAAQISGGDKYFGTNAILLGDRIAPQTTEFQNGEIIVNFAERKPGEPFSAQPSVGVSKYFKVINKELTQITK